jgi:ribosomal protein L4
MVVLHDFNETVELGTRNLSYAFVCTDQHTSVYDILDADSLVVTKEVVKYFEEALSE